jgi:hypothetical protein
MFGTAVDNPSLFATQTRQAAATASDGVTLKLEEKIEVKANPLSETAIRN